ncbi:MAG: hypothetical protein ACPHM0_00200 [Flavobacteriales bacterium]
MVSEFPPHFLTGEAAPVGDGIEDAHVPGFDLPHKLFFVYAELLGARLYAPVLAFNHLEEFHQ